MNWPTFAKLLCCLKTKFACTLSCAEPGVEGCGVRGAGYALDTPLKVSKCIHHGGQNLIPPDGHKKLLN